MGHVSIEMIIDLKARGSKISYSMIEMETDLLRFSLSIGINGFGATLAALKRYLKVPSGALAAFIVGFGLFTFSFLAWILLLAFFISSSLLTKFKSSLKTEVQEKFEKGGQRDAWQVFANGLPPVFYILFLTFYFSFDLLSPLFIAIAAYFAAVNADTFSTEIGILAKSPPRWILNPGRIVDKGTSGGVTALGSFAGVIGSFEISCILTFGIFLVDSRLSFSVLLLVMGIVFISGILGNIIDSLLGASVQGFYLCPSCHIGTEKRIHLKCGGTETRLVRGWESFTNDWVNILSATIASLFAAILWGFLY